MYWLPKARFTSVSSVDSLNICLHHRRVKLRAQWFFVILVHVHVQWHETSYMYRYWKRYPCFSVNWNIHWPRGGPYTVFDDICGKYLCWYMYIHVHCTRCIQKTALFDDASNLRVGFVIPRILAINKRMLPFVPRLTDSVHVCQQ